MGVVNEVDPSPTLKTEYARRAVQPLLIALNATALVTAMLAFLQLLVPDQPWLWLIPFCFLVTLEALYTTIWLHHPERLRINRWLYRVTEIIALLVVTRLLTWGLADSWPFARGVDLLYDPSIALSDLYFILGVVIVLIAWERAVTIGYIFHYMAVDRAEEAFYAQPSRLRNEYNRPIATHRSMLRHRFVQQWIWGGVVLAILAAMSTVDVRGVVTQSGPFQLLRLGMRTEMLLALLGYFGAGFALLSQARLAMMNARWMIGQVRKTAALEHSWSRQTVWLLLVVGGVAAFIPLGSTTLIGRLLELFVQLMAFVASFVFFLMLSLLTILSAGLMGERPPTSSDLPEPPPPPAFPAEPPPVATAPDLPIAGTLFWLMALIIIIEALFFFFGERHWGIRRGLLGHLWQMVRGWWQAFWRGLAVQTAEWREAWQTRLVDEETAEPAQRRWRFIRLKALSPRQKLRYFYLAAVRRAGERGVVRQESETPLEYATDLTEHWPQTDTQVNALTRAFHKARYSQTAVTGREADEAQAEWQRLRRELKKRDDVSSPSPPED